MLIKNVAMTRLVFLIAYIADYVGVIALKFLILPVDKGGFDLEASANSACTGMSEEELEKYTEYHGEDCTVSMKRYITYSIITGISFFTLIWLHFVLVIATYYTEAAEAEAKETGSPDEEETEPLVE